MEWNAVICFRIHIVRLIIAHKDVARSAQSGKHRLSKAAVDMAGDRNMPWPWYTGKHSRHRMNGNHNRLDSPCLAILQDRLNRIVIWMKPACDTDFSVSLAEMQVARDHCAVAYLRDEVRKIELAVAVDHKARGIAEYRRGIEDFRERRGNARRADIPGNVPGAFSRRQTQVVKFLRDIIAGMIAEEDKAAGPLWAEG